VDYEFTFIVLKSTLEQIVDAKTTPCAKAVELTRYRGVRCRLHLDLRQYWSRIAQQLGSVRDHRRPESLFMMKNLRAAVSFAAHSSALSDA